MTMVTLTSKTKEKLDFSQSLNKLSHHTLKLATVRILLTASEALFIPFSSDSFSMISILDACLQSFNHNVTQLFIAPQKFPQDTYLLSIRMDVNDIGNDVRQTRASFTEEFIDIMILIKNMEIDCIVMPSGEPITWQSVKACHFYALKSFTI